MCHRHLNERVPAAPNTSAGPSEDNTSNIQIALAKLEVLQKDSIGFRLLSAFLKHAPTDNGVNVIASDIITSSASPDDLKQLAEFYKTGLLLPMRAGGLITRVSSHPSRNEEIRLDAEKIAVDLETAKRDPGMLKKYALLRDGYRCVATRTWDKSSLSIPSVRREFNSAPGVKHVSQAAYILPLSLMRADMHKEYNKATIWSVITSFTGIEFKELNGDVINSLKNVITLTTSAHDLFGTLDLWFEAVPDTANTYKIRKSDHYYLYNILDDGTEVTFTSPNPVMLPLPDPRYLAFHAAIAKIVHMAGMAQHLDHIVENYENICLVSDESGLEYFDGLLRAARIESK